MKMQDSKSGSMAMSADTKTDTMAMKPMKKSKKKMMADKPIAGDTMKTDGAMKADDGMKH
jgi:hypothetical protein